MIYTLVKMVIHSGIGKQDNQQERLGRVMVKISDDYLIGFTEGEGVFYVGIVPSKETRTGWQVIYYFKVTQNPCGKEVLEYFKKRLGCGYLKANHQYDLIDQTLAFVVRDLDSIKNQVIPFFRGKLAIKKDAFEKFTKVIELVSSGQHLQRRGIGQILDLAYSMNTGKRRISKEQILKDYSD